MLQLLSSLHTAAIPGCVCREQAVCPPLSLSIYQRLSLHLVPYHISAELQMSWVAVMRAAVSLSLSLRLAAFWACCGNQRQLFHTPIRIPLKLGHCLTKWPLLREACVRASIVCESTYFSVHEWSAWKKIRDWLSMYACEKVWAVLKCEKKRSMRQEEGLCMTRTKNWEANQSVAAFGVERGGMRLNAAREADTERYSLFSEREQVNRGR